MLHYLSGFFDGEGSISFNNNGRSVDIRVTQTIEEPLQRYVNMFGGTIQFVQITKGGLACFNYRTSKREICGDILTKLYPMLIVKQARAQVALERLGLPIPEQQEEVLDGYFAGFYDAEGSVHIVNYTSVSVCVTQVDKVPLLLFQQRFGGNICHKGNGVYGWFLRSKELQEFCNALIPYLVVKKEQLILLKRFQSIDLRRKENRDNGDLIDEKRDLAVEINDINNRVFNYENDCVFTL